MRPRVADAIVPASFVSTAIVAAALLDPLGMLVRRLRPGLDAPSTGARCASSFTAIGANVGNGSADRTTVTNLWFVRYDDAPSGWIVKTAGGAYWFESPDSSYYEQITAINADELLQKRIAIGGCFRGDLAP